MMNKIVLCAVVVGTLSACGFTPVYKKGESAYDFVGCHAVSVNPSEDGSKAFIGPGIPLKLGDTVWFKQVNDDLTVSPVTTGSYCE
jgi:hypothetical protein